MIRSISFTIVLLATSGAVAGPTSVMVPSQGQEQLSVDDGVAHESDLQLRPIETREGLFISEAPSGIQDAWNATVGLFIPNKWGTFGNGSGSIVKMEPSGPSTTKVFILTAYHVAVTGVKTVGASSPKEFEVVTNVFMDHDSQELKGKADFKILGHGIKVEKAAKDSDLALVSIEIRNDDLSSITKIQLSDCEIGRQSIVYS